MGLAIDGILYCIMWYFFIDTLPSVIERLKVAPNDPLAIFLPFLILINCSIFMNGSSYVFALGINYMTSIALSAALVAIGIIFTTFKLSYNKFMYIYYSSIALYVIVMTGYPIYIEYIM